MALNIPWYRKGPEADHHGRHNTFLESEWYIPSTMVCYTICRTVKAIML